MLNCNYKSSFNKKKAFTLIELLIVIAIIGILFIVLVSKVDFATDKAKASGVQTDFRSFSNALETVSKENAGFNTFGWDTGDNGAGIAAGATITLNGKSYTYTNATKDAGDRIRNSYDEGDTNLNGTYDDGEVWTGRKVYTETWTGCYTLINPGNASDMSAIFDLETAINKNLDLKLHIVIADDGTISMANGLKDPWSTQYHGRYITNASADAAAQWNTDASMAGSTGDNMDRGAILMYSNGANQKFGTKVKIVGGVVTATVSQIDANHPDNNKMGADDYVLAVVYSYTNGYGETAAITKGFSNNQAFSTGNGGMVDNFGVGNSDGALNTDKIYPAYLFREPEVNINSTEYIAIRINVDLTKFRGVQLNGNDVDASYYNARQGSTIIEFKPSFVSLLRIGTNDIVLIFDDGKAIMSMEGYSCTHSSMYDCFCEDCGRYFHEYDWAHACLICSYEPYYYDDDVNGDNICDICFGCLSARDHGGEHINTDGDIYCDVCGYEICSYNGDWLPVEWYPSKCVDANADDRCDYCGYWVELHCDQDDDGMCDYCSSTMCQHGKHPSWSNIGFEPIDENNEKHSILYACNECGTIKRESGNHTNDLQIEYAYLDDMDTHTIIYTCEECDYSWIELEDHYNYYCEYIEVTYDDNEHSLWYECICGETCADVYEHSYHSYDEPGEEYTYISDGTENSTHHYAIVKCYDCDHTTVSNEKISCSFDIYDYSYIDENYHYEHRRCNACGNTQSIKCEHDFYDEDIVYCNCGGR